MRFNFMNCHASFLLQVLHFITIGASRKTYRFIWSWIIHTFCGCTISFLYCNNLSLKCHVALRRGSFYSRKNGPKTSYLVCFTIKPDRVDTKILFVDKKILARKMQMRFWFCNRVLDLNLKVLLNVVSGAGILHRLNGEGINTMKRSMRWFR